MRAVWIMIAAALAVVAPASSALADDVPSRPDGQTRSTCLYERWWDELCSVPWVISKAEEDAQFGTPGKPVTRPAAKPAATRPAAKPAATRPAAKPATRPAVSPARTTGRVDQVVEPRRVYFASVPGPSVRVEAGESLWSIAVDVLGDGFRWPEIAAANGLPSWGSPTIYAGEALRLP